MQVMIRWKVRPEQLDNELAMLHDVHRELDSLRPGGIRYTTVQLEDKVTFIDLVELDSGPEQLQGLPAFQRYRHGLEERCEEPPVMSLLHEVGSYPAR